MKLLSAAAAVLLGIQVLAAPLVEVTPNDGAVLQFDDTLTFTVQAQSELGISDADFLIWNDNHSFMTIIPMAQFPFSITFSNMPPGNHFYRVVVTDPAGSTDLSRTIQVGPPPPKPAAPFTLRELGENCFPLAINNKGQIGGYLLLEGRKKAFLADTFQLQELPGLGGAESAVLDVNNNGVAVGWATTTSGRTNAVIWDKGGLAIVPGTAEEESWANGLNDLGEVVGVAGSTGFLWHDNVLRRFPVAAYAINNNGLVCGGGATFESSLYRGKPAETSIHLIAIQGGISRGTPPEAARRVLYAVNDSGMCVGWGYVRSAQEFGHGELLYTIRSQPVSTGDQSSNGYSEGLAINKWGQYAGFYQPAWYNYDPFDPEYNGTGWYLRPPVATFNGGDLNLQLAAPTPLTLRRATGINDAGQIVGLGERDGIKYGFILQPQLQMGLQRSSDRAMIEIKGSPHQEVRLESSTDLLDWQELTTRTLTSEPLTHADSNSLPKRFYRTVRLK